MNQRYSTVKSSELLNEAQRESKQGQNAAGASRGTKFNIPRRLPVLFIAMAIGLSACGQKGDLYLPDEKPEQTKR